MKWIRLTLSILFIYTLTACDSSSNTSEDESEDMFTEEFIEEITDDYVENMHPTLNHPDISYIILEPADLDGKYHHTRHAELFGKYVQGYNHIILEAIDVIQAKFPTGGGYFADATITDPPESPIGYAVSFLGHQLIEPTRDSSFCTGATYAALIEALNIIFEDQDVTLTDNRLDAIRMQEEDGSRREDYVRLWGSWNVPFGNKLALADYTGMGEEIDPANALPGDFMYFEKSNGLGHMAVFLGYYVNYNYEKVVIYWSSQEQTKGLGDGFSYAGSINNVKFVRLTDPEKLLTFNIDRQISVSGLEGDELDW